MKCRFLEFVEFGTESRSMSQLKRSFPKSIAGFSAEIGAGFRILLELKCNFPKFSVEFGTGFSARFLGTN